MAGADGMADVARAVGGHADEPVEPRLLHHQRAVGGAGKLARGLAARFGPAPTDFDCWHYLALLWQLNDLWPAVSWSVIDSAGRLEPPTHELRRLYDDLLVVIMPVDAPGSVGPGLARIEHLPPAIEIAVRSSRRELTSAALIRRIDVTGRALTTAMVDVELDSGVDLLIEAPSLVHDLLVQPDQVSTAGVSDGGLITLLPVERKLIRSEGVRADAAARVLAEPVMWTLDRVIHS